MPRACAPHRRHGRLGCGQDDRRRPPLARDARRAVPRRRRPAPAVERREDGGGHAARRRRPVAVARRRRGASSPGGGGSWSRARRCKRAYRDGSARRRRRCVFVHLDGCAELLAARAAARDGSLHAAGAAAPRSSATLEPLEADETRRLRSPSARRSPRSWAGLSSLREVHSACRRTLLPTHRIPHDGHGNDGWASDDCSDESRWHGPNAAAVRRRSTTSPSWRGQSVDGLASARQARPHQRQDRGAIRAAAEPRLPDQPHGARAADRTQSDVGAPRRRHHESGGLRHRPRAPNRRRARRATPSSSRSPRSPGEAEASISRCCRASTGSCSRRRASQPKDRRLAAAQADGSHQSRRRGIAGVLPDVESGGDGDRGPPRGLGSTSIAYLAGPEASWISRAPVGGSARSGGALGVGVVEIGPDSPDDRGRTRCLRRVIASKATRRGASTT